MTDMLTPAQRKGLLKIGDILIPGNHELPSFSRSDCAGAIDRMLPFMNTSDRQGVEMILTLFAFLPSFLVRAFFALTETHRYVPEPLAGVLRLANIGVKGVVMTLYYSDVGTGVSVHEVIGWDAKVVEPESEVREVA